MKQWLFIAAVGSASIFSAVEIAIATPLPNANPTETQLEGWCNENGGDFFQSKSSTEGVYACAQRDGPLIACGGAIPVCGQSERLGGKSLFGLKSIIGMQTQVLEQLKTLKASVQLLDERLAEAEKDMKQR